MLNSGTGRAGALRSAETVAEFAVVIRTLPAGPSGQRSSRSAALRRSSSTTSQGRVVWLSQPMKLLATDSALLPSSAPMAAAASMYPDSTDARLVAATQTSKSAARDRHSDSAKYTAIWVLPHACRQSGDAPAIVWSGVSTTVAPGTSVVPRSGAVSGLALKPSASGGIAPVLAGNVAPGTCDPVDPAALAWLSTG